MLGSQSSVFVRHLERVLYGYLIDRFNLQRQWCRDLSYFRLACLFLDGLLPDMCIGLSQTLYVLISSWCKVRKLKPISYAGDHVSWGWNDFIIPGYSNLCRRCIHAPCRIWYVPEFLMAVSSPIHQHFGASALAAVSCLRSFAGFGFPLFAPAMYAKLGYGKGNTILACLAIGLGCPA